MKSWLWRTVASVASLQSDLLEQITKLAASKNFDYMIIEGSGVSEPAQIAKLFADCEDDHDHENEHPDTPMLGEVARLDTCVTVVDVFQHAGGQTSLARALEGEFIATFGRANRILQCGVAQQNRLDRGNPAPGHSRPCLLAKSGGQANPVSELANPGHGGC